MGIIIKLFIVFAIVCFTIVIMCWLWLVYVVYNIAFKNDIDTSFKSFQVEYKKFIFGTSKNPHHFLKVYRRIVFIILLFEIYVLGLLKILAL